MVDGGLWISRTRRRALFMLCELEESAIHNPQSTIHNQSSCPFCFLPSPWSRWLYGSPCKPDLAGAQDFLEFGQERVRGADPRALTGLDRDPLPSGNRNLEDHRHGAGMALQSFVH